MRAGQDRNLELVATPATIFTSGSAFLTHFLFWVFTRRPTLTPFIILLFTPHSSFPPSTTPPLCCCFASFHDLWLFMTFCVFFRQFSHIRAASLNQVVQNTHSQKMFENMKNYKKKVDPLVIATLWHGVHVFPPLLACFHSRKIRLDVCAIKNAIQSQWRLKISFILQNTHAKTQK